MELVIIELSNPSCLQENIRMKLRDFNFYSNLVGKKLDDFEQHVMASKILVPSPGKPRIHMRTSTENVDILKQLINKYPLLSKWNIKVLDADASIIGRAAQSSEDNLMGEGEMSKKYDLQTNLERKLEAERSADGYIKMNANQMAREILIFATEVLPENIEKLLNNEQLHPLKKESIRKEYALTQLAIAFNLSDMHYQDVFPESNKLSLEFNKELTNYFLHDRPESNLSEEEILEYINLLHNIMHQRTLTYYEALKASDFSIEKAFEGFIKLFQSHIESILLNDKPVEGVMRLNRAVSFSLSIHLKMACADVLSSFIEKILNWLNGIEIVENDHDSEIIISCPQCSLKLRIPSGRTLLITCTKCNYKFENQNLRLPEEEKQRIYEEEKIRLEAKVKAKKDFVIKTAKDIKEKVAVPLKFSKNVLKPALKETFKETKNSILFKFSLLVVVLIFGYIADVQKFEMFEQEAGPINIVKNGHFAEFPDKTIREAANNYFDNPSWETFKGKDGNSYVNIGGELSFREETVSAILQFKVDTETGGFEVASFEMNGEAQTNQMINGLIAKMYE